MPVRSISTSSWARGGAPGSAAGRRAHVLRASQGASTAMITRLANVAIKIAGIRSTPPPTGGAAT